MCSSDLATISILLPLTFGIKPVGAILMLAGVMYGAQYGGAICSVLLNLPCHPPHAVTCLDGFPMTKQGRGGVALGVTVFASTLYWQESTPQDTRPWIAPDLPVAMTRAAYLANRDPLVEAILRYQTVSAAGTPGACD